MEEDSGWYTLKLGIQQSWLKECLINGAGL